MERFVEIGPAPVLCNMAEKTIDTFYADYDAAKTVKRSLLSVVRDYHTLCYETGAPSEVEVPTLEETNQKQIHRDARPASASGGKGSDPSSQVRGKSIAIPDVPLEALDSVKAIAAVSIKRAMTEQDNQTTVRRLSGDRSTIENEIVGNLIEEFGDVPHDVENMSLQDIATELQRNHSGRMGRCLRKLTARIFTSKMPASLDLNALRQQLNDEWGLGSSRQDAVLLIILARQPPSKILSLDDARAFVDRIAQAYVTKMHRWNDRAQGIHQQIMETLHSEDSSRMEVLRTLNAPERTEQHDPAILSSGVKSTAVHAIRMLQKRGSSWEPFHELNAQLSSPHRTIDKGRTILLTGAGPASIGASLLPLLLQSDNTVILATSRPMSEAGSFYQDIYARWAGIGSRLIIAPFNQASHQDVITLVNFIYDRGWDLDRIVPFAAISETGNEIDAIGSQSELAHRAMSVNVLRLMGAVKVQKEARSFTTRPAQVLLPLSPNDGKFGKDGLYSESKLALTAVLNKWSSESWSDYLCLCGVLIGWTKGTGLMGQQDEIADAMAKNGVKIFSSKETAHQLLVIMSPPVVSACQDESLIADMSGGLNEIISLAKLTTACRRSLREKAQIRQCILQERVLDDRTTRGSYDTKLLSDHITLKPRTNVKIHFPALPDYTSEIQPLQGTLSGMVDLDSVVVVVGIAEIGPLGNARTRWDMETHGRFSQEACLELAWMTGMIRYSAELIHSEDSTSGGWVDAETNVPVQECDIRTLYKSRIADRTGLRLVEPGTFDHPDRSKKQALQEMLVQHDLEPFKVSRELAHELKREQEDKIEIERAGDNDEEWYARLKKGAIIAVPKAAEFDRIVGGQVPTGWDSKMYGIPDDICNSGDRCTLFALVCTAEAFLSAGITDTYELYRTIHVSEMANCIGSGTGGMESLRKLFRERHLDHQVSADILTETFVNTTAAWLNMLLLSSCGPTRTPVGACATALESLNQGFDLISSGAAKVCVVGGVDAMIQDYSAELANMNATINSASDLSGGRAPHETSRPMTSSRAGFVESEGCGVQILTSAKLALELGLPIRAIVADARTASDGLGNSVPAPGKGLLSSVREEPSRFPSPLLDIRFRRRLLTNQLESIRRSKVVETSYISEQCSNAALSTAQREDFVKEIDLARSREERDAKRRYGNEFWTHDARISPLRGALAVWNLTADDITALSMHGTSTVMNDTNEAEVLHRQLDQLGRSTGNPAFAVCQKYLTGHPKGAAAAWMLNGACQMIDSGLVPGNRNADNIDSSLEQWHHIVFPSRSIQVADFKAFSITSFGFGQKGAQALGVHPRYLFATISQEEYAGYCKKRAQRLPKAQQRLQNAFYGGRLVDIKSEPPHKHKE